MRIVRFHPEHPNDYCCNLYWVVADSARAQDRNTLVDAGSSHPDNLGWLLREMDRHPKGIGRRAVEQVVLTHAHYDHVGGLPALAAQFRPEVHAWLKEPGVDQTVADGTWLRIADRDFRVLHTPGHSPDSICLYCPESRDLFTGDTLYRISDAGGTYPRCYVRSLERLLELKAAVIWPGHGDPVTSGVDAFIAAALANVKASNLEP